MARRDALKSKQCAVLQANADWTRPGGCVWLWKCCDNRAGALFRRFPEGVQSDVGYVIVESDCKTARFFTFYLVV